jgi:sterol desaturase/sphingolipid hydroxylase (fatty acid hydroxylase superfamily)
MQGLIQYFTNISDEARAAFLISGLAFFFLLEFGIPLFKMEYNKTKHAFINITFTVITLIVNLFGAALILAAVKYNESNGTGLLNLATLPPWLYILLGLILMDLIGAWLIHWIQHKVKWLWKFHIIHHTDPNVDVTSGLRHHPGENIFRLLFTSLAVVVSGASFGLVMMYQTISAFFAHFSHANIQMPLAIDKAFSYIFVTPNFHKVHHHYIQPHTDSNYGNIFSIWDHLLRTTTSVNKMDEITYGIDTHMAPEENSNIKNLLMIPFQKYRAPVGSKFSD